MVLGDNINDRTGQFIFLGQRDRIPGMRQDYQSAEAWRDLIMRILSAPLGSLQKIRVV